MNTMSMIMIITERLYEYRTERGNRTNQSDCSK